MTKAENRAAAKAYQQEKLSKLREESQAAAVAADLEQLAACGIPDLRQKGWHLSRLPD